MAKIRLDGKLTCANDCPFGRFDFQKERTMCMFNQYQSECRAETIELNVDVMIFYHTFNLENCEYISKEN